MPFTDRYRAAGLSHNPFRAWQPGDPQPTGFVDRGLAAPPPPGSRTLVQVIGEAGSGKSTQLQQWRAHTPGPYHYIPRAPYRSRWATPPLPDPDHNVVYGDEIDRMPSPLRSRWFRSLARANATLIIGTHVDLSSLGSNAGLAVVTHVLQRADRALLRRIVDERLRAASTGEPGRVQFDDAHIELIAHESAGNPRDADVICHRILADLVRQRTAAVGPQRLFENRLDA